MPAINIYSERSFRFRFGEDSAFRVAPGFIDSSRTITGSNTAAFRSNYLLTSGQASLAVNFQDLRAARVLFVDTDSSIRIIMNTNHSVICGRTSVANTVGRPFLCLEGSIIALNLINRIPSAATSVRVVALGLSAT